MTKEETIEKLEQAFSFMVECGDTRSAAEDCYKIAKEFSNQQTAELKAKLSQAEADKQELLEKHKNDVMQAFATGLHTKRTDLNAFQYYKETFETL